MSSIFISLIWPVTLNFLVGFIIYVSVLITLPKISKFCVWEVFNNLPFCVSIQIHVVDIASWGTPSPSSAIYNFGHSVRGWAIGT